MTSNLSNLSSNLPLKNSAGSSSSSSRRAQNLSVSTLQQKKDRAAATTSIGRAIDKQNINTPTTSIGRVGQSAQKNTSIAHDDDTKRSVYDDENIDEVRDRLRYHHIRELMQEKKAAEQEAKKNTEPAKYDVGVKTGGGFKIKGKGNFISKLKSLRRNKPASFKNLSNKDIDYFANTIKSHAKGVTRGTGISRSARTSMKSKIEKDRQAGVISSVDAKGMKKMVDELPH